MSSGILEYTLMVDTQKGVVSVKNATDEFNNMGNKAQQAAKKGSKGIKGMINEMMGLNQAVELGKKAFHTLYEPIKDIIMTASSAGETSSKFFQVFKSEAPAAQSFILDLATNLGRSKTALTGYMSSFQDTFVPLGFARDQAREFSQTLTGLTLDLASFHDEAESEVLESVQSYMVGNHETMRKYGVIVNETRLGQELLNMGILGGARAATEAQKAQARLNILMHDTSDAQNDASRTADSFANRLRSFGAVWEDVKEAAGSAIIETILPQMQDMAKWIKENREAIEEFARKAGKSIGEFLVMIGDIGKFLYKSRDELILFGKIAAAVFAAKKINNFGNGILGVVEKVGGLSGGMKTLKGGVGGLKGALGKLGPIAGAAFAGWGIGTLINDITGLRQASFEINKFEMLKAEHRSYQKTGITELTIAKREHQNQIRALAASLGVQGTSMLKSAEAILNNKKAYESLTPAQKKVVDGYGQAIPKVKEIEEKLLKEAEAREIAKKAAEAQEKARKNTTAALIRENAELTKFTESLGFLSIGAMQGLTKESTRLVTVFEAQHGQLETNKIAFGNLKESVDETIQKHKDLGVEVPPELKKTQTALELLSDAQIDFKEEEEEFVKFAKNTLEPSIGGTTELILGQGDASFQASEDTHLLKTSIELGNEITVTWMESLIGLSGTLEGVSGLISQGTSSLERFGLIGGKTADTFNQIGGGIGEIGGGLAAVGKEGASFFDKASGWIGTISGVASVATGVIGGIISLLGGDKIQEAINVQNSWMGMSEQLNDTIYETADAIGSVHAATSLYLDDIMAENLNESNISDYARRLHEIQDDVIQGTLNQAEANRAMGSSFEILINEAEKFGKEGTYKIFQVIRQERHLRLDVDEINQYVYAELEGGISALNTYLQTFQGEYSEVSGFVEANTMRLFGALEGEGYSFLEVTKIMGESLESLREKALTEGVAISEPIQGMLDLTDFITQNETLLQNIDSTRQMQDSLSDSVYMTEELFVSFGSEAQRQFDALLAADATEVEALRILAPMLHERVEIAESYNFAIDAQTQSLLDQAEQEGVMHEGSISAMEKQILLMEEMVLALGGKIPYVTEEMAQEMITSLDLIEEETQVLQEGLGGIDDQIVTIGDTVEQLPATAEDMMENVTTSFSSILDETQVWQQGLEDIDGQIDTIGDSVSLLDDRVTYHMTGNSIVTQTTLWDDVLGAVDDKLYTLGDTFQVLDSEYYTVMSNMTEATEMLYLSQDGVIRNLEDTLALQGLLTYDQIGGKYGVFTDEEKQDLTVEFSQMSHLWAENFETIISDESWMTRFTSDLNSLQGGIIDGSMDLYDEFVDSINWWNNKVQEGFTWNEETGKFNPLPPEPETEPEIETVTEPETEPEIEAATGYHAWLDGPTNIKLGNTRILAGEAGREFFSITPEAELFKPQILPDSRPEPEPVNISIPLPTQNSERLPGREAAPVPMRSDINIYVTINNNTDTDIMEEFINGIKRNGEVRQLIQEVARS